MRQIIAFALIALFFGVRPPLELAQNSQLEDRQTEALVQKIRAGDPSAIAEAGRSGNRLFVPYLREALANHDRKDIDTAGPARVALAKLGETDQLQEEWCRAISEDPMTGLEAPIIELGSIGGWFAVQGMAKFLTPEGQVHFYRATAKMKSDDIMRFPPMYYALKALPEIVPNPPVHFSKEEADHQSIVWRDWIAAHKEELSKLQPTGEGVDFSANACKDGKSRKRR